MGSSGCLCSWAVFSLSWKSNGWLTCLCLIPPAQDRGAARVLRRRGKRREGQRRTSGNGSEEWMSWRREKRRPSLPNPEIQAGGVKPVCFWTRTYGSERWSSFSLKRKCRRQFRVRASIRPIHRKQHSHLVTYQLLRSDG